MLLHVVGARPNFPKLAPVFHAAAERGLPQRVIHTGQHYDDALSTAILRDVGAPVPDVVLETGSASHAVQTARLLTALEPELLAHREAWIVVYGDVNSTLAAALVAAKEQLRLAHVEAGVRSGDLRMPEEVNRIVTDQLATLCLAPTDAAAAQLAREGIAGARVAVVGNVMVDMVKRVMREGLPPAALPRDVEPGSYVLVTLHRPSNVDEPERLAALMRMLDTIAGDRPVLFPVHPRTASRLAHAHLLARRVRIMAPMPYRAMLALQASAHCVITDSGGVQLESSVLGTPCVTARTSSEWGETLTHGTNVLAHDPADILVAVADADTRRRPMTLAGWDGLAAQRIIDAILAREAA